LVHSFTANAICTLSAVSKLQALPHDTWTMIEAWVLELQSRTRTECKLTFFATPKVFPD